MRIGYLSNLFLKISNFLISFSFTAHVLVNSQFSSKTLVYFKIYIKLTQDLSYVNSRFDIVYVRRIINVYTKKYFDYGY